MFKRVEFVMEILSLAIKYIATVSVVLHEQ